MIVPQERALRAMLLASNHSRNERLRAQGALLPRLTHTFPYNDRRFAVAQGRKSGG